MFLEFGIIRERPLRLTSLVLFAAWTATMVEAVPAAGPARVLRVGLSDDAPLMFRDADGRPTGFSIDLLREIAKRANWRLEFVDGSWSECVARLEDGSIDVVGTIIETPRRAKRLTLCDPPIYIEWGELLLSPRSTGTTMRDLRRGRIGLLEGDAQAEAFLRLLDQFGVEVRARWYPSYTEMIRDTRAHRLDGMVGISIEGHESYITESLVRTGLMFNPSAAKIGFRRDVDPEVVSEASAALRAMQKEEGAGSLKALIDKYCVRPDEDVERLPRWAVLVLIIGGAGLTVLATFSILLKRLVSTRTSALAQREAQLEQAAGIVGMGYWTYDVWKKTFTTNDTLLEGVFEGTLSKDIHEEEYIKMLLPDDRRRVKAAWGDFLGGNAEKLDITYGVRVQDRTKYIRSRSMAIIGGKGPHPKIHGVSVDVTAFKESESLLRKSEARLSRTFDAFPVMVAFATPEGLPIYCNELWSEKLGYSDEEILAFLSNGIIHPDDWARSCEARRAVISGEQQAVTLCKRLCRADGSLLWVEVTYGAIRDCDGTLLHLVILAVDVTDQRLAQQELRDARDRAETANRTKSAFLATMSHEIRTPLNAILGFSNLLSRETLPAKSAGFVDSIQTAGGVLMRLLNNVLDFSKIEANRLRILPVPTDMSTLLGEMDAIFRAGASKKGVRLSVENRMCDNHLLMLDMKHLRQVLLNLVGNAVKFTDEGRIDLTAESAIHPKWPDRREVTIRVADTGIGICPEDRNRVFDAFEQRQTSNRRRFDGTGLGLTISKRLVDAMGGRLELDNESTSGSVFMVHLPDVPVSERTPQAAEGEASVVPQFASARVLIVDDVKDNASVLAEMVRNLGLVPKTVSSGEAALERIERNRPDLIMTDLLMPGLSGEELASAVRKNPVSTTIPIVGVTAAADWREWCDIRLFDAILSKPVGLKALIATFDRVLKRIDRTGSEDAPHAPQLEPHVAQTVASRFGDRILLVEQGAVDFDDVLTLADEMHALAMAINSRPLIEVAFALVESAEEFELRTIRRILQDSLPQGIKELTYA